MRSVSKAAIPLALGLFLMAGAGCKEQEKKAEEKGKAVINTLKQAEKNIDDAVSQMKEKTKQLE